MATSNIRDNCGLLNCGLKIVDVAAVNTQSHRPQLFSHCTVRARAVFWHQLCDQG